MKPLSYIISILCLSTCTATTTAPTPPEPTPEPDPYDDSQITDSAELERLYEKYLWEND